MSNVYIVKDGKAQLTVTRYNRVGINQLSAIERLVNKVNELSGTCIEVKKDTDLDKSIPVLSVGNNRWAKMFLMGDATSYENTVAQHDGSIYALGYTTKGIVQALDRITDALVGENGDVFIPESAFGTVPTVLPEKKDAFNDFWLTYYGPPSFSSNDPKDWNETDRRTLDDIIKFGVDEIPAYFFGYKDDEQSVSVIKSFINEFYSHNIKVRPYFVNNGKLQQLFDEGKTDEIEADIKRTVELFGDMEGIGQWGLYDEPLEDKQLKYCGFIRQCFHKHDPMDRPVYINMGPVTLQDWCNGETVYDKLLEWTDPDYYCYDKYPFRVTDDGKPVMYEDNWYANLEQNRSYAIDGARNTGAILGAIKVGADPSRHDITQEFMDWQVNLMLAYHYRYLESYVYYPVHDFCMLGKGNVPTFRWHIARKCNQYAKTVGRMLLNKRLDAVFHLRNSSIPLGHDGFKHDYPDIEENHYSFGTVTYFGYRGLGNVTGEDAMLSFFDDGTIIVTDKRCCDIDGGDHTVIIEGLRGGVEIFNGISGEWEIIQTCKNARQTPNGLELKLTRSSQFILRAK